jgi:hypothetical protein
MQWRFNGPDDSWRERAAGTILSVTLIGGVAALWVGALVLMVERFAF